MGERPAHAKPDDRCFCGRGTWTHSCWPTDKDRLRHLILLNTYAMIRSAPRQASGITAIIASGDSASASRILRRNFARASGFRGKPRPKDSHLDGTNMPLSRKASIPPWLIGLALE
jgi:hypothetical protein